MVSVIRHADVSYGTDRTGFLKRLVQANEQRKKSPAMLLREAAMKIDPAEAVKRLGV
jgi:hypothetical protein